MNRRNGPLSGNALKIIAAFAMLADHVGLMFFPRVSLFRIVGRLALPIFAFMIAEGCRYTRNRLRYFLQIFLLAAACQIVYFLVDKSLYMSILVTFSCSILMIFALQKMKEAFLAGGSDKFFWLLVFVSGVAGVYILNRLLMIDYGFWGCMLPLFPSLFQNRHAAEHKCLGKLDTSAVHIGMLAAGLLLLWWDLGGNQLWSLMAIPVLLHYSGKRGKLPMKYFFYVFYPAHLALLQLIDWIM